MEELREECGVFGIQLKKSNNEIIKNLYFGLFALQHRGQESAGIAFIKDNKIEVLKSKGLVAGDFFGTLPFDVSSKTGIGHVRYSTCGESNLLNAQPFTFNCNKGEIAIAHNGNIPSSNKMKNELIEKGSIFQTTSDSEILIHLLSRNNGTDFDKSLIMSLNELNGAYAMLMIHDETLIAFRDKFGYRPLCYGEIDGGYVFASETNAMDLVGAKNIKEVEPGEIVFCKNGEITKTRFVQAKKLNQCVFELIYFARPDSFVFGESVHVTRLKMGAKLSKLNKNKIDIVISVPDSGNSAALGFSKESNVDFDYGLIRNHYTGRTFIKPEQKVRTESVKIKLNPIKSVIEGKSVAVVDDSLVRGTTSRKIVNMLKEAGAKEVHLFLSSPEIKHSCFFGINTPTEKELISSRFDPIEIAKELGADSVTFIGIKELRECLSEPDKFCYACFDGNYAIDINDESISFCK